MQWRWFEWKMGGREEWEEGQDGGAGKVCKGGRREEGKGNLPLWLLCLFPQCLWSVLSIALAGSVWYRLDIRIPQSKALQEAVLKILLTPNVTNLWTIELSQYAAIFALRNILICQSNDTELYGTMSYCNIAVYCAYWVNWNWITGMWMLKNFFFCMKT